MTRALWSMREIEAVARKIQEELMYQSDRWILVRVNAEKVRDLWTLATRVELCAASGAPSARAEEKLFQLRKSGIDSLFFSFLCEILHEYSFFAAGYVDIYARRAGQRDDGNDYFFAAQVAYV